MISLAEIVIFVSLASSSWLGIVVARRMLVRTETKKLQPEKLLRGSWQVPKNLTNKSSNSFEKSDVSQRDLSKRLDGYLKRLIEQSGLSCDATTMLLLIVGVSVLSGVAAKVAGLSMPFPILIAGVLLGAALLLLLVIAARRQKQFVEQFPAAIDMLARSVRAGESFEEAIASVASTIAEPAAGEFKRLAQELSLGRHVSESMADFANRNVADDVKMFAHAVSLHRESGGRLAETLARLASVVRLRADCLRKIQSATSLGKFAAIVIGAASFVVLTYMLLVHPEYIGRLWNSEAGRKLVYYGAASEAVGLLWVATTLKQKY